MSLFSLLQLLKPWHAPFRWFREGHGQSLCSNLCENLIQCNIKWVCFDKLCWNDLFMASKGTASEIYFVVSFHWRLGNSKSRLEPMKCFPRTVSIECQSAENPYYKSLCWKLASVSKRKIKHLNICCRESLEYISQAKVFP